MECYSKNNKLEDYFAGFRGGIIGNDQYFDSPFGTKKILYADWTASGRAYQPIEDRIQRNIMPFMANTHTTSTITGTVMSQAYEHAKIIIKRHVNASNSDVLVFCGTGMTSAVNKLQRTLGLRIPERIRDYIKKDSEFPFLDEILKPIVFITEMEHHSNHLTWLETIADVEIISNTRHGNVDLKHFRILLEQYGHRKTKIAAVTACSNVTGIQTPYHEIAKMIHEFEGLCFVDFACSAPYVDMNMHPDDRHAHLDAIYFSPHKFLGGPGTPGILVYSKKIYHNKIPDQPGGGTVTYSSPWKTHDYIADIEQREDGGTPPVLQGIKAAMCVRLKENMGVQNIQTREKEILEIIFTRLAKIKNIELLERNITNRLGVISFIVKEAHYNLIVKMLNDRFGIQTRGGCSCAGTYGHMLLKVDKARSYKLRKAIQSGNFAGKPGWIRLSVHPTMTNNEIGFIMDAIELTASRFPEWSKDYVYNPLSNEYTFNGFAAPGPAKMEDWFNC